MRCPEGRSAGNRPLHPSSPLPALCWGLRLTPGKTRRRKPLGIFHLNEFWGRKHSVYKAEMIRGTKSEYLGGFSWLKSRELKSTQQSHCPAFLYGYTGSREECLRLRTPLQQLSPSQVPEGCHLPQHSADFPLSKLWGKGGSQTPLAPLWKIFGQEDYSKCRMWHQIAKYSSHKAIHCYREMQFNMGLRQSIWNQLHLDAEPCFTLKNTWTYVSKFPFFCHYSYQGKMKCHFLALI